MRSKNIHQKFEINFVEWRVFWHINIGFYDYSHPTKVTILFLIRMFVPKLNIWLVFILFLLFIGPFRPRVVRQMKRGVKLK